MSVYIHGMPEIGNNTKPEKSNTWLIVFAMAVVQEDVSKQ